MATAYSPEDAISCSLCMDIFNDPRNLPCGHTFCLQCLQDHINAHLDVNNKTFMCPHCRHVVNIPDHNQPAATYANQFPCAVALVSAIEAVKHLKLRELPSWYFIKSLY